MGDGGCSKVFIESNVRPQSWVLPGVPCPLDDAPLWYRRHLCCQRQLMDPSRPLPKICRVRFQLKKHKASPPSFHVGSELRHQSTLLVPVRAEDASLLLTCCEHSANNPCINPAKGPAFGHRAVIVRGRQKHRASLGWGREHVDLLGAGMGKNLPPIMDVTWKQTLEGQ